MERAGSLTRGRRPTPGRVWFLAPVLVAACAVAAVIVVPGSARLPVIWCGVAATVSVALAAGEITRRGRLIDQLRSGLERHVQATEHVAYQALPPLVNQLQDGALADELIPHDLTPSGVDPRLAEAHLSMVRVIVQTLQAKEFQRDSAQRAIVNIACRIQAEIHRLQADLRRMQFKHGHDPDAMGDFMHLEHGVNVTGRVATSLAVLGGGSPARQWRRTVSLYDVLRLGSAPITEYRRVKRHRVAEIGVVGPAVEPLSIVLAELLDNATRYSPPNTTVIMNTEEVASGVEISIEDKGTGLTEESRKRAEFLLVQGIDGMDLDELGESARMGLRVAGILAHQHNLRISLRPSACDGVRAIVFVPHNWLTTLPMPPRPPGVDSRPPLPAPATPAPRGVEEAESEYTRNANGLPQRRRRPVTGLPNAAARSRAAQRRKSAETAPEPGLWMADFFDGTDTTEKPSSDSEQPAGSES